MTSRPEMVRSTPKLIEMAIIQGIDRPCHYLHFRLIPRPLSEGDLRKQKEVGSRSVTWKSGGPEGPTRTEDPTLRGPFGEVESGRAWDLKTGTTRADPTATASSSLGWPAWRALPCEPSLVTWPPGLEGYCSTGIPNYLSVRPGGLHQQVSRCDERLLICRRNGEEGALCLAGQRRSFSFHSLLLKDFAWWLSWCADAVIETQGKWLAADKEERGHQAAFHPGQMNQQGGVSFGKVVCFVIGNWSCNELLYFLKLSRENDKTFLALGVLHQDLLSSFDLRTPRPETHFALVTVPSSPPPHATSVLAKSRSQKPGPFPTNTPKITVPAVQEAQPQKGKVSLAARAKIAAKVEMEKIAKVSWGLQGAGGGGCGVCLHRRRSARRADTWVISISYSRGDQRAEAKDEPYDEAVLGKLRGGGGERHFSMPNHEKKAQITKRYTQHHEKRHSDIKADIEKRKDSPKVVSRDQQREEHARGDRT
ncbi:hypothetical protein BDK51DRAFT_25959 [Blyttiomyces helicus]|uniref:Uncharacterized protein n=1 Tax=Blyttiomyces helicus TaxID=388810 RepID=A0A4P9WPQ6_9FUNG|nr:hypothetical protein BDK51DRAFT_25959 [Blyttiomyces helicus]|eukprot:RKO94522.1 hypothetical protein BDK51DRAFT_25959 [Blyttiomyces helicus]